MTYLLKDHFFLGLSESDRPRIHKDTCSAQELLREAELNGLTTENLMLKQATDCSLTWSMIWVTKAIETPHGDCEDLGHSQCGGEAHSGPCNFHAV